ncbi:hypothetical protein PFISCL1PPCAC_9991, partial [Pristionchus fissidentatus]
MIYLLLAGYALFWLYRHWEDKKNYWKRRGINGPEPEMFFGNAKALRDYENPRSLVIRNWTRQYGKVYGIHEGFKKILVVSDLETTNELLVKKFDHFTNRIKFLLQSDEDTPKTNLIQASGMHWKRLRALGSYAFTNKALKNIQLTVENSSSIMTEELKRRSELGEVNMLEFYQEFTLDVICKIALGQKDVEMFKNPLMDLCRNIFSAPQSYKFTNILIFLPFIKKPMIFLLGKLARYRKHPYLNLMRDVEVAVEQRKKEREAGASSSGDFIDIFLDAEVESNDLEESKVSRKLLFDEIVSQCIVMLLAGFETTANSLSYLTHFLANHPDVQEKIYEEVQAVFPHEINYEDLSELKYTEAAIKESLRHYPLGSFVVSRECQKRTTLGGMQLEVGDSVLTDTWSLHMDKTIWG